MKWFHHFADDVFIYLSIPQDDRKHNANFQVDPHLIFSLVRPSKGYSSVALSLVYAPAFCLFG